MWIDHPLFSQIYNYLNPAQLNTHLPWIHKQVYTSEYKLYPVAIKEYLSNCKRHGKRKGAGELGKRSNCFSFPNTFRQVQVYAAEGKGGWQELEGCANVFYSVAYSGRGITTAIISFALGTSCCHLSHRRKVMKTFWRYGRLLISFEGWFVWRKGLINCE